MSVVPNQSKSGLRTKIRSRERHHNKRAGVRAFVSLLIAAAVWQLLAQFSALNAAILPPPSEVVKEALTLLRSGELTTNLVGSLLRVAVGFGLAAVAGVGIGAATFLVPPFGRWLAPLVEVLRPIPPIAWIPIAILWFGLGNNAAVFIVFLGAFFPIFVTATFSIRGVSQSYVNAAKCLGVRQWLMITDVIFPAALPGIVDGLRISMGVAWTCVIAAEMVGAQDGLGYAIQLDSVTLNAAGIIVYMLTIGAVGWAMISGIGVLSQHMLSWNQGGLQIDRAGGHNDII